MSCISFEFCLSFIWNFYHKPLKSELRELRTKPKVSRLHYNICRFVQTCAPRFLGVCDTMKRCSQIKQEPHSWHSDGVRTFSAIDMIIKNVLWFPMNLFSVLGILGASGLLNHPKTKCKLACGNLRAMPSQDGRDGGGWRSGANGGATTARGWPTMSFKTISAQTSSEMRQKRGLIGPELRPLF